MQIRFWGVRGSIAASGPHVARVGGNTTCVEVTHEGQVLILDAGTGIRALGESWMRRCPGQALSATLLFSHLHWDHVQGFPFFTPAYVPGNALTLMGPGADGATRLEQALQRQMQPPSFPVGLDAMRASLSFASAQAGVSFTRGPFSITPMALSHPNGCLGYRIEAAGRSFVFATDVEVTHESLSDAARAGFAETDLLCMDAQYTPDEYEGRGTLSKKGWGHSTMMDAARIAQATKAKRLLLFHHDPAHDDDTVERMAEQARRVFPLVEPAREGLCVEL